jgi:hypothetical protein
VLVSGYNVIRDMVSEMRGRHVLLLSCDASPLRFLVVLYFCHKILPDRTRLTNTLVRRESSKIVMINLKGHRVYT